MSKYCRDCKHYGQSVYAVIGTVHYCLRDQSKEKKLNLVTGQEELSIHGDVRDCDRERFGGECGEEGKFWESK